MVPNSPWTNGIQSLATKGFIAITDVLTACALTPIISSMVELAQTFSSGIIALIFILFFRESDKTISTIDVDGAKNKHFSTEESK